MHDVTSQWLVIFTLWKYRFSYFHKITAYEDITFIQRIKPGVSRLEILIIFLTSIPWLLVLEFLKPGFTLSYNHSLNMLRIVYPYCCINIMNSILVSLWLGIFRSNKGHFRQRLTRIGQYGQWNIRQILLIKSPPNMGEDRTFGCDYRWFRPSFNSTFTGFE